MKKRSVYIFFFGQMKGEGNCCQINSFWYLNGEGVNYSKISGTKREKKHLNFFFSFLDLRRAFDNNPIVSSSRKVPVISVSFLF